MKVFAVAFLFWAVWITSANADPGSQTRERIPISGYDYEDVYCMAQNVYFEARGTSFLDQVMVSLVVLERVEQDFYPDTICEVVKQGSLRTGEIYDWIERDGQLIQIPSCQFSWYCDGRSDDPTDVESFKRALSVTWYVLNNPRLKQLSDGADHYHAHTVKPSWAGTSVPRFVTSTDGHQYWARK